MLLRSFVDVFFIRRVFQRLQDRKYLGSHSPNSCKSLACTYLLGSPWVEGGLLAEKAPLLLVNFLLLQNTYSRQHLALQGHRYQRRKLKPKQLIYNLDHQGHGCDLPISISLSTDCLSHHLNHEYDAHQEMHFRCQKLFLLVPWQYSSAKLLILIQINILQGCLVFSFVPMYSDLSSFWPIYSAWPLPSPHFSPFYNIIS